MRLPALQEPPLGGTKPELGDRIGGSRSSELGEQRTVDLSQGRIQFRERGQGPVLRFVPGLYVNGDLWRKVASRSAASGAARAACDVDFVGTSSAVSAPRRPPPRSRGLLIWPRLRG
jgi:hypothetical protein